MARELTRTAAALHEVPIAAMVKATALGLIEAQYELDMNMIELAVRMGEKRGEIGQNRAAHYWNSGSHPPCISSRRP